MNLVELMEIWRLTTGRQNNLDYLLDIFSNAALDIRIDREILALEILGECGTQTPRYMDTTFFATMAVNFFKVRQREIERNLNVLEAEYDPLQSFNVERDGGRFKRDIIDRTTVRTDDLEQYTENGEVSTTHKVSADNESAFQNRSQDVTAADDETITNTGTQTHKDDANNKYITKTHDNESGRREAAQNLLLSELEANKKANIYKLLAREFSHELMVCVY